MIGRRYSRLLAEGAELPELIVVDGGKGQLRFAYETLQRLGLEHKIAIVGLAKRIEEVGRIPDCPDRMAELSRRLAQDGIKLKRSRGGDLQYRFHSKSLGGERKVNGARLGYVTHRRTGRTIRFTYHGVMRAIKLCMQLYRTMDYITRDMC